MHALTGGHLEQVEHESRARGSVPEHRDRAEVERAGPEPDQMRGDPVELEVDHAQVLARGGTSIPSSVSTAPQNAIALK